MDNVTEINPLSSSSFFIEMMFNDEVIACGTAFYYCSEEKTYLISNWHNYSGRHPDTKKPFHSKLATPNKIRVHGHSVANLSIPEIHNYDLLDSNSSPLWYQHPHFESAVDVAALPVAESNSNTFDIMSAVRELDPFNDWPIEVGEQLFVLGFPFGISDSYRFPIWKAANLASEPKLDQENLPLLYVDTATREGMSGSPVIVYRRRAVTLSNGARSSKFHATFIGVYAGRIVPKDQLEAQLGRVWKAKCIEEIIRGVSCPPVDCYAPDGG